MPRSYRRNKKRFFKRYGSKRGKFTRYQTFKNRSSRSQANQIYQLSKRISRVEKRNTPEYLQMMGALKDYDTLTDGSWAFNYIDLMLQSDGVTRLKDSITGDKIKLVNLTLWGYVKRNQTVSVDQNINNSVAAMKTPCFYMYMIFGLLPKQTSDFPAITQFINFAGQQDQPDIIFNSPLRKGCGSVMKIIKIKKIKITNWNVQSVPFKISIPLKYRSSYKSGFDVYMSNNPVVLFAMCQNVNTTTITPQNKSAFDVQMRYQLTYTDN